MTDELVKKEPAELDLVNQENQQLKGQIVTLQDAVRLLKREHTHLTGLTGKLVSDQAAQNRRNLPVDWRTRSYIESELPMARVEVRVVSAAFAIASQIPFNPNRDKDENVEFHLALRRLMEVRTGKSIPLTIKDVEAEMSNLIQKYLGMEPKERRKSYEEYLKEGLKEPLPKL